MKIGEVARETGLSEKAIRVYVENGLVKPEVTQSLHRNAYEFTRENVKQLEQIAVYEIAVDVYAGGYTVGSSIIDLPQGVSVVDAPESIAVRIVRIAG